MKVNFPFFLENEYSKASLTHQRNIIKQKLTSLIRLGSIVITRFCYFCLFVCFIFLPVTSAETETERLELFLNNYDVIKESYKTLITCWTVKKWLKIAPDNIVETTPLYCSILRSRKVTASCKTQFDNDRSHTINHQHYERLNLIQKWHV